MKDPTHIPHYVLHACMLRGAKLPFKGTDVWPVVPEQAAKESANEPTYETPA